MLERNQPYCTSCHRSAANLRSAMTLSPCKLCHLVFTCDACKSVHPAQECAWYKQVGNDELFRIDMYEKHNKCTAQNPLETPRRTYTPLSSTSDWYDYHARVADRPFIKEFVRPDFTLDLTLSGQILEPGGAEATSSYWTFLRFASETSTMPLTKLSALEKGLPSLTTRSRLSIHIIGASMREWENLMVFEEILHLLPTVNHL